MCEGMMIHALRNKVSGHVTEGSNHFTTGAR